MNTDQRRWKSGVIASSAFIGVHLWLNSPARAQLTPPTLRTTKPVGLSPGAAAEITFRGSDLDGSTALVCDDPRVKVEGLTGGKDQLKAKVSFPQGLASGPLPFRAITPRGISAPARLWAGRSLPTRPEIEPNNGFAKAQAVPIPVAIDGEVNDGNEVDVFAVELQAGETLVAEVIAGRAGSGLDALVMIFGPDGRELAFDDDRFGPDAAAWATAPKAGRYFVQVQDANGRNPDAKFEQGKTREYRLELGRLPLVAAANPGGVRRGTATEIQLRGANLPGNGLLRVDLPGDAPLGDRPLPLEGANAWNLRVGDPPEADEAEPNDEVDQAQGVTVPATIHGTFGKGPEADIDVFRLKAGPGQEGDFVVSAYAARIGSPADPTLAALDDKGATRSEDDDALGRDARLALRIDSAGGALLAIRERFGRGGERFTYRIEVERAGGRLAITADAGARTLPRDGGLAVPLAVDGRGVEGAWTLAAEGLPAGVAADPVALPAGAKGALLVLTATADAPLGPFPLRLAARPADDKARPGTPVAIAFQEFRSPRATPGAPEGGTKPAPAVPDVPLMTLAVAERAPLGLAIEPRELTLTPGGQAEFKINLDRRGDDARKPVKLRLLAGAGGFDGLEVPAEVAVAADANTATLALKAKPDAAPRRLTLSVRAHFDGTPEALGVSASPATLVVPGRPE